MKCPLNPPNGGPEAWPLRNSLPSRWLQAPGQGKMRPECDDDLPAREAGIPIWAPAHSCAAEQQQKAAAAEAGRCCKLQHPGRPRSPSAWAWALGEGQRPPPLDRQTDRHGHGQLTPLRTVIASQHACPATPRACTHAHTRSHRTAAAGRSRAHRQRAVSAATFFDGAGAGDMLVVLAAAAERNTAHGRLGRRCFFLAGGLGISGE